MTAARSTKAPDAAGRGVLRAASWLLLAFTTVYFIVPVLWLVITPSKDDSALVRSNPLAFGSLENISRAWANLLEFQDGAYLTWFGNSIFYSVSALVLTVLACIPAGYGLAMTRFRGRTLLLAATLIVMLVPDTALVLPIYLELSAVHLTGTPLSVILPFSFYPFGVYLTYIYYSTALPKDLLAAARIDGCNEWQLFTRIALPLAKPVIALVAFFGFVGNWNNYFLPLVMLARDETYPLQLGLEQLVAATPAFNPGIGGGNLEINRPELALAVLVAVLPVLLLFMFSQRTLVSGMLAGATKE
ncbi:carbohydrate ABC transporter permease [Microbacterium sp. BK668]|uniref:carbohydrate ABC transporter permease n=1 Tax=Microbacterium sp. BK668 TaxID=2512118 RepID=UPI001060005F|nr:carbohydrate ABC transporter permease [Microbacterium sp. BK668]TDN91564.1 carbohydrate ABC transporter membrane protein 2 (CUT1 family) [Microbacterium sp. BK668]